MTTRSRMLAALVPMTVLLGCATEPNAKVVGPLTANGTANFSPWSDPVSLPINSSLADQQAALSQDGQTVYFASTGAGGLLDIWVSHRPCVGSLTDCPWEPPVSVAPVNSPVSDFAPVLSRDGHWLFFGSRRSGSVPNADGAPSSDIWVSWRDKVHDDLGWQTPVNLGTGVNTAGFEGGPGYFENDDVGAPQLYFNRNPMDVNTGGDIYVSEQLADESWGTAVPVAELNSDATDQHPALAPSGLEIYFHSNRLGSTPPSGTTDIWVATRGSVLDPWSTPTNLGFPINTAAAESGASIFSHGRTQELYFTRTVPGSGNDMFVSTRTRQGDGS